MLAYPRISGTMSQSCFSQALTKEKMLQKSYRILNSPYIVEQDEKSGFGLRNGKEIVPCY